MEDFEYIIKFESDILTYRNVSINGTEGKGIVKGVTIVCGPNGSGKSTLGNIISKGRHAFNNRMKYFPENMRVKMLSFSNIHALTGIDVEHYTQRLEATANEFVPTVAEVIGEKSGSDIWCDISRRLNLENALSKKINYLSSGEMRKLLVANILSESPEVIILDNPYIGLDAPSRNEFNAIIKEVVKSNVSIIMLIADPEEIPDYTDALIWIKNRNIEGIYGVENLQGKIKEISEDQTLKQKLNIPFTRHVEKRFENHDVSFEIHNGHIKYGDKTILENFSWRVKRGECWALNGPNGSGKSLLLSIVCGDHPQAYANDITIFDRKRGSGESIWDIKDSVGYLSPEIQLYFKSSSTVREIVAKGKRNMLNRASKATEEELFEAGQWLDFMGISHLKDRNFKELSNGEKQLVQLASIMIKRPKLMILDEPFHGLDNLNKSRIKNAINQITENNHTTLIFVTHSPAETPECVSMIKSIDGKELPVKRF